jgi:hypothetical protein
VEEMDESLLMVSIDEPIDSVLIATLCSGLISIARVFWVLITIDPSNPLSIALIDVSSFCNILPAITAGMLILLGRGG